MPKPNDFSRRGLLLSGVAAGLLGTAGPAFSSQGALDADGAARRRINLSGRQRMLSQRMSRAIFFCALEIEKPRHLKILGQAHALFDQTLKGLRAGDEALGLPEEQNANVLATLDAVDDVWSLFNAAVEDVIDRGEVSEADVQYVARFNLDLLGTSNAVVKSLVTEYGNKSTDMGLAISIDVAGRQRMLSQKMAKEAAMIALGLDMAENQAALMKTIQLFDGSLTALMTGLPTITLPPPPPNILAKLEEVQALWAGYQKAVRFVADSGFASQIELGAIAAQADPVLVTMNEAVGLYEEI